MDERTTNNNGEKERQEAYASTKASDHQGMGADRQWYRSSRETSDTPSYSVSLEEDAGAGCRGILEREKTKTRPKAQGTGGRKQAAQRGIDITDTGANAFKKRDELGLSSRRKGSTYTFKQRQRIIEEVNRLKAEGINIEKAIIGLGIVRSTYYGWLKGADNKAKKVRQPLISLTDAERQAIINKKEAEPQMTHRIISGILRHDGHWISPSSCYRVLKALGYVSEAIYREAPWKTPRYEPFRPNQIWGEDWTILTIDSIRYYLLTIIDYFSRYIVAWGIVKTVTQREVKDILTLAYINEGIENNALKPKLRLDRGSPNMAHDTRRLIADLEMVISPSRVNRPTDNSRQERWYRTVKQEEIYCYPTYPSIDVARISLSRYIEYYHEIRPHQALWNYTPGYVHRLGNKSLLLEQYRQAVNDARERRKMVNALKILDQDGATKLTPFFA